MSPTVRDGGMTHHVGDDCPGGHMESPQPDTRAVVQREPGAVEAWLTLNEVGADTALVEFWRPELYAFADQHDAADAKARDDVALLADRIKELEAALEEIATHNRDMHGYCGTISAVMERLHPKEAR